MQCISIDLGLTDYKQARAFQKECVDGVKSKVAEGFLIFTEHKPVFTLGRFAKWDNLLIDVETAESYGVEIIKTDRGGDITFHGPGQLLVYPILNLTDNRRDVHSFLRDLEEIVIRALAEFNVFSYRFNGRTGVWTKKGKIASIGIGISRWVTYHGIAINANVDLRYFEMIYPCGFKDIKVTSIKDILKKEIDSDILKCKLTRHFCDVFNLTIVKKTYGAFEGAIR